VLRATAPLAVARLGDLILDRHIGKWTTARGDRAFAWLQRAHWALLAVSVITICCAVAGSHGWSVF